MILVAQKKEKENHRSSEHVESDNFSCSKCYFSSKKKIDVDLHISTIHENNCNTFSSFSTRKKVKKSTKVKKNLPTSYGGALNAPVTVTVSVLQLCI